MFFHRINERHSLRQLTLKDAEELYAVIDANRIYLRQWLPWLDRTQSPADSRSFIESADRQNQQRQGFHTAILVDDRIAGAIGYHRIDWANRATSLGYWLGESHQGSGIMTASCQALIDHAFAALNLHRVTIACATGNARSRAIPVRLGFIHEGTHRDAEWIYNHFVDHEVYSQLQREWQGTMIQRLAAKAHQLGRTAPRPS